MNCDDFLEALESRDERLRNAAQWHANACSHCAALADVDAQLKDELAPSEPLPPRLRALWESAAIESPQSTLARRARESRALASQLPMQLVSFAAALLLFLTVALLIWQRPGEVAKGPDRIKESPDVAVETIDASSELDKLLAQVTALEAELQNTSKQIELVDARREADVLLATYSHW
jgi:hypothetical protein